MRSTQSSQSSGTPSSRTPRSRAGLTASGLALLALFVPALGAGCASSSSARAGASSSSEEDAPPMRITLRDYLGGMYFELVNPSHTDPVEYYSRERQGASRKIVATEVVAALIEYLEDNGLEDYAQLGRLPNQVQKGTRGFEIEGPGGTAHWVVRNTSDAEERTVMNDCTKTFLETYNLVMAYQAIENDTGGRYFKSGSL